MKRKLINTPALAGAALVALSLGTPNVHAQEFHAALRASPAAHNGQCPAKITFSGRIRADRAGRVQYRFIRSDGAVAPIQTLNFERPGSQSISTTWTLGGDRLPRYDGWQAVEIVYPTAMVSDRAAFSVRCADTPRTTVGSKVKEVVRMTVPRLKLPDLKVKLNAPRSAEPGDTIGHTITARAFNVGEAGAAGTASAGSNGYMIDVVLSKDTNVVDGFAAYAPNYSDDVLLQGGRVSNTVDLAPGASHAYPNLQGGNGTIPADTSPGSYYVCARIDPGKKTAESNESNNVDCQRIKIAKQGKPDLMVRSFGLKRWGSCAPNNAVITFQVTVANVGTVASPAVTDYALVQVMDQHRNWGNGVMLGVIAPGATRTVEIPVYYLREDPAHMTGAAPHPFMAKVDPGNRVDESNEGNNQSATINVGAPAGCR